MAQARYSWGLFSYGINQTKRYSDRIPHCMHFGLYEERRHARLSVDSSIVPASNGAISNPRTSTLTQVSLPERKTLV